MTKTEFRERWGYGFGRSASNCEEFRNDLSALLIAERAPLVEALRAVTDLLDSTEPGPDDEREELIERAIAAARAALAKERP